jgi:hypothetical protein
MGHGPYAIVRRVVRPMTHGGEDGVRPMGHGELVFHGSWVVR